MRQQFSVNSYPSGTDFPSPPAFPSGNNSSPILPSGAVSSRSSGPASIWQWALSASLDRLAQSATMTASHAGSSAAATPFARSLQPIGLIINGSSSSSFPTSASFAYFVSQNSSADFMPPNTVHWRHPLVALLFICFCCMTIFGNCLVVLAVFTKKYLRNPTGYLIVSLAVADLIVGLVVMPLNSLFEMSRHVWLLGLITCDIWHALDILASTSSIWNLCVISLDRYMAGIDPIGYRDRVSKRRIIYCICCVWMLSACISFPAIFWWRASSPHLYTDRGRCLFTDDAYYVVFSSMISFYIPLVLILFAYGRVYCIATTHSRSMKSGEKRILLKRRNRNSGKSAKSGSPAPNQSSRNHSAGSETLRIHFGQKRPTLAGTGRGGLLDDGVHPLTAGDESTELRRKMLNGLLLEHNCSAGTLRKMSTNSLSMHTISAHYPPAVQQLNNQQHNTGTSARDALMKSSRTNSFSAPEGKKFPPTADSTNPAAAAALWLVHKRSGTPSPSPFACTLTASNTPKASIVSWSTGGGENPTAAANGRATTTTPQANTTATANAGGTDLLTANGQDGVRSGTGSRKRLAGGMREKSRQMIKQLNEQRAARTLSIVVGVFIFCWTPFFLFTPLIALCGNEKSFSDYETVFSVFTWAGHLNSMLNPLIYSRFSRDFRKAFKQILTCERERPTKKAIKSPLNIVLAQLTSMAQIPPPIKLGESSEG
uniref:G-protein coupled receptors family 1 profile domain-containing protein n=1 Tax=Globodera rostochiensis TaxID=31243 RepID=A0A914GSG5_GLORO